MSFRGVNFLNFNKDGIIDEKRVINLLLNKQLEHSLIEKIKGDLSLMKIKSSSAIEKIVKQNIVEYLRGCIKSFEIDTVSYPHVIALIGVNGSGKTTTSFKMANLLTNLEYKTSLVSCDIVRPGALFQFNELCKKVAVDADYKKKGEKIFNFIEKKINFAIENKYDIFVLDTPGIVVGNKATLDYVSEIIGSVKDLIGKDRSFSTIFIADANLGGDIMSQIMFLKNTVKIDGIFISKFETTSKIGQILKAAKTFKIPITGIGNGISVTKIDKITPDDLSNMIFNVKELGNEAH
ncbi:hypothetical protein [Candidatus Deianiraea vastatrix]|uniref:Signal recognition particle protein n=1 Tax=Candidatus Deianiraea vastatrix TaxID=2163644 RepID=A0A5B8XE34_9RICK|nr:hypothetical protein [Candidatus Deianiraea vastatrix]QED23572.1 Signal recognition particle protein [Candidatus Deianiraea vastatrix]